MADQEENESTSTDDYQSAVIAVAMCGKMLAQHDLPKLLQAIERAEVMGPLLDPTLWRAKSKAMAEDRAAIEAAIPLRALFALRPLADETTEPKGAKDR